MDKVILGQISTIPSKKNVVIDRDNDLTGIKRTSERRILFQYTFTYEIQSHKTDGVYKTEEGEKNIFVKCDINTPIAEIDELAKEKFIEKFYSNDRIIHSSIAKKKRLY